ncbi:hypothetical protein SADUNF_Sadunf17G0073300 [Salix dunnii]|uniref:Clp1 C-terminal domain-containing protein n=1 Tax=Salix dunnii TaxID=1413687 RepID=A0A835J700_9ROSI|nr:hypothetical protein SADUNF_Sadunf17G0073300 [Salix dunnii]
MLKINITFRYLSFVFCFPNPRISNLHFTGSKSVMKENIDRDLLQVFLAVSYAQEPDQIVSSNVAGFIYVTDIDLQRRKITCLSPTAGELANVLSPHSNIANFSDFFGYRISGGFQAPRSALPIGADPVANPLRVAPVNMDRDLLHVALAV